jgi:uncharacterized repeat protein (TIGR03803 family)
MVIVVNSSSSVNSRKTPMAILTLAVLLLSATLGGQEVRTHTYTVLYSFQGGEDGAFPVARLLRDKTGIYGTTSYGGGLATCHPLGCGTVFKLKKTGKETLLHKFTGAPDGAYPSGGVLKDAAGNVYGTTSAGGTGVNCYNGSCGIVFKLDKTGKETVLYNFSGGTDGAGPVGDLIQDDAGNFYGATDAGGGSGCGGYGCGTVFEVTP